MDSTGYSIIIPAHNVAGFIKECLDSIQNQDAWTKYPNIKYEICLGIDGCMHTLNAVKGICESYNHLNVYYSEANNGSYVTANSMLAKAQHPHIIKFDADDVMMPNLVSYIHENKDVSPRHQYIRLKFRNFDKSIKHARAPSQWGALGVFYMHRDVYNHLGGFKDWRCAGDFDISNRHRKTGLPAQTKSEIALFYRRRHPNSLTQLRETCLKSQYRTEKVAEIKSNKGPVKIDPVVGDFKLI